MPNSNYDLTLSYNDLADTPDDNPWDEREQRVNLIVSGGGVAVNVNNFTKTLVLGTTLSDKQFDVYLTPPAGRTAQVIFVQGAFDDDVYLNLFNAFDPQVGAEKICTIRGKENAMISLLSTRKYIKLETDKDLIVGGFTDGSDNHVITDIAPPIMQIRDTSTDADETEHFIFMTASQITKPRKIILWWIPQIAGNENKPCRVMVQTGPATVEVALTLQPFHPCECLVFFDSANNLTQIVPTGYLLQAEGPKAYETRCAVHRHRKPLCIRYYRSSRVFEYLVCKTDRSDSGKRPDRRNHPVQAPAELEGRLAYPDIRRVDERPEQADTFQAVVCVRMQRQVLLDRSRRHGKLRSEDCTRRHQRGGEVRVLCRNRNGTDARYSTDMSCFAEIDDNSRIMVHIETFNVGGIVFFYDYRKHYVVNPPWGG